jgi:hypothetical protein
MAAGSHSMPPGSRQSPSPDRATEGSDLNAIQGRPCVRQRSEVVASGRRERYSLFAGPTPLPAQIFPVLVGLQGMATGSGDLRTADQTNGVFVERRQARAGDPTHDREIVERHAADDHAKFHVHSHRDTGRDDVVIPELAPVGINLRNPEETIHGGAHAEGFQF